MPDADGRIRGVSVPRVPWHESETRCYAPYAYIGDHPWCGEPDCERCSMVLKGQERLSNENGPHKATR